MRVKIDEAPLPAVHERTRPQDEASRTVAVLANKAVFPIA